ncbi:hypothetical protein ACFLQ2_03770 [archaeon]
MNKILLMLVLGMFVVSLAGTGMAVKPETLGDDAVDAADAVDGLNTSLRGKPEKAGNGKPETNDTTVRGKPETNDTTVKGKPETNKTLRLNQGRLISTVTKVRQEQFRLTKENLKVIGYKGSMSDFATSYNVAMNRLKTRIRERMQDESNFTRAVVRNLMERELAQIRERLMVNRTVTDEEVVGGIGVLASNETINPEETDAPTPEEVQEAVEEELEYMDEDFKEKLVLVAEVGTPEEQEELAEQLEDFTEAQDEEVEPIEFDAEEVREGLEEEEGPYDGVEEQE